MKSKVREYHDVPVKELMERAEEATKGRSNVTVYFKFTCENCGSRQTFDTPNTFYTSGRCEECNHVTELDKGGFALEIIR